MNSRSSMTIALAKLWFNSTAISTKRVSFLLASTSNTLKSSPGSTCCCLLEVSESLSSYVSHTFSRRTPLMWNWCVDHFFWNPWPWRSSSQGCGRKTLGLCVLDDVPHVVYRIIYNDCTPSFARHWQCLQHRQMNQSSRSYRRWVRPRSDPHFRWEHIQETCALDHIDTHPHFRLVKMNMRSIEMEQ